MITAPTHTGRVSITRDAGFKTREDNGQKILAGYFAVFDGYYYFGEDAERIDPHAFDNWRNKDVRRLTNHDDTLVLGRTTAGTLTLKIDAHGLYGEIIINENDRRALDTYYRVQRGDVTQCSFGFEIVEEYAEERENGGLMWVITDINLYEVSVCTFPAYEDTVINARAKDAQAMRDKKIEAWKKAALERLRGLKNGIKSDNDPS